jgi:2-polyprenyl-3-methyl-5-hydroxy-6-metoxy-1,4-benzoquinol methylase
MLAALQHVRHRRRVLATRFDLQRQTQALEETCVPSYLHRNGLAAAVAWWRLFAAVALFRRFSEPGPVLDFGAGSGELAHLLPGHTDYEFIEADEGMARAVKVNRPGAVRKQLETVPPGRYAAIFALDSLEHNEDVPRIMDLLVASLRTEGILVLSGPTENALYRLGRRIAGFSGHYHKTTIYEIEKVAAERLTLLRRRSLPLGIPMFSVSCWRRG